MIVFVVLFASPGASTFAWPDERVSPGAGSFDPAVVGFVDAIASAVGGLDPMAAELLVAGVTSVRAAGLAGSFADPLARADALVVVAETLEVMRNASRPRVGAGAGAGGETALAAAVGALLDAHAEASRLAARSLPSGHGRVPSLSAVMDQVRTSAEHGGDLVAEFDGLALVEAVDLEGLARAQAVLVAAVVYAQRALGDLDVDAPSGVQGSCASGSVLLEVPGATGAGPGGVQTCYLVIGGPGATHYHGNVTVSIDLGGADLYENNAGAWDPRGFACDVIYLDNRHGASLALDLGEDDDVYAVEVPRWGGVQGAGIQGVGVLVDGGGDDLYRAHDRSGDRCSYLTVQGSGYYGAGLLWDQGAGDDRYSATPFAQGAGVAGIGVLLDEGGSDVYETPVDTYDPEGAQGSGCVGIGFFEDQGRGDDVYLAGVADVQASACLGAVGVLHERGGNDTYRIIAGPGELNGQQGVVQSGWGQAHGEIGGVALLMERGGDDVYETLPVLEENRTGFRVQGVGVRGVALLLDESGVDEYHASQQVQAYGYAEGTGVLVDGSGNDVYVAADLCQGSVGDRRVGDGAMGVLVDWGGLDSYQCGETPELGVRADGETWVTTRGFDPNVVGVPWPFRGATQFGIGMDHPG